MPFDVSTGCLLPVISGNHINPITHIDTAPEMRVWEKIKEFFGHAQQSGALACIQTIYHPPAGTTREDICIRFEQIRMLAHFGYEENIQSGRHGSNHLCILDANSHEILSVTLDDTGNYILECEGDRKTHTLATTPQQTAEAPPKTAEDYDAIWTAWGRAPLPGETSSRAAVVEKMRSCLHDNCTTLSLNNLDLITLPDYLPPNILALEIEGSQFTSLPALPSGLQNLKVRDAPLTSLPALPSGLQTLGMYNTSLTSLPMLPSGLQNLWVVNTPLTSPPTLSSGLQQLEMYGTLLTGLPMLPSGLQSLEVGGNTLASLPALPSGLQSLEVIGSLLTSLPALPSGLRSLEVNHLALTSLPGLPSGLQKLHTTDTDLTSLPALPSGLQSLKMHETPMTKLPALPSGLQSLEVHDTPLTNLPALPSGLQSLEVHDTPLTNLPSLPSGLQSLEVHDTPLTNLPALPSGLQSLEVYHAPLANLPMLPSELQSLKVYDITLTCLSTLPSGLHTLEIYDTLLASLPTLPSGLRNLWILGTALTSLPALPSGLQSLKVYDTPLTNLPILPPGLQRLEVSDSALTSLPMLPPGLQRLEVSDSALTSLPMLPSGLQSLEANNIQLTSLPTLPSRLQELHITYTELTNLPVLPSGIQKLKVNHTELTSLPENIASLSSQAEVDLSNNPLTELALRTLRNMATDPDYSGPRIHFSMNNYSAVQETRPLHLAVSGWLTPTYEGQQAPSDRWQNFGQQDNAASFSRFLDKLSGTKNVEKDPGFKTQIASWLTHLACDDELRAKTFAMATEATSSCEDRITLALNNMKNVHLVHRAEKGEFDNNHPGLVSVGREMFRLEKLEQIAREKACTLRFIDEIEVYLAYQNKLREVLGLTSVTKEMRFFGVADVTESDLKSAEIQVKTAENSEFMTWILQWAPLHSMLQRTKPVLWTALVEQKISDYKNTYQMLSDTELKPAELLDNHDAVRTIGARAMESAEKAFLKELRPEVKRMLAGHLNARWP